MKKISIVGVLVEGADWILHPITYYKELQGYRKDYEREVLDFQKHIEKLKLKIQVKDESFDDLQKKYDNVRAKLSELNEAKNLLKKESSNMKTTVRSLENKLIYRNRVVESLRNDKREFKYQIQELEKMLDEARSEVVALAKKVEFYEKQAKKTPKEKVDYLMKRGKK